MLCVRILMGRRSSSEDCEWSRAVVETSDRDVSPIMSGVFFVVVEG
jgi:hypothetical protein